MGRLGSDMEVQFLPGVGPKRAELLRKELGASTVGELLRIYPFRYIDKSGFLVLLHREKLKNRAKALRCDREKIAVQNADFSNQERGIEQKMHNTKKAIADAVLSCENYGDITIINKALYSFTNAVLQYDGYYKTNFSNIQQKQGRIDRISEHLSLAADILDGNKIPQF